jgi:hypothetical protein
VIYEGRDGHQTTLADVIPDDRQMEEMIQRQRSEDVCKRINAFVRSRFKPKIAESFILYQGLGDESGEEITLEEAGKRGGVTREMIRQRVAKVLNDPAFKWFIMKNFGSDYRGTIESGRDDGTELRERLKRQDR